MSDSLQVRISTESLGNTAASQTGRAADVAQTPSSSRGGQSARGVEDSVELSSLSERIASAAKAGAAQQADRVRQLTALYQSGRYQVDSMSVSKALVAQSLGVGSTDNGR